MNVSGTDTKYPTWQDSAVSVGGSRQMPSKFAFQRGPGETGSQSGPKAPMNSIYQPTNSRQHHSEATSAKNCNTFPAYKDHSSVNLQPQTSGISCASYGNPSPGSTSQRPMIDSAKEIPVSEQSLGELMHGFHQRLTSVEREINQTQWWLNNLARRVETLHSHASDLAGSKLTANRDNCDTKSGNSISSAEVWQLRFAESEKGRHEDMEKIVGAVTGLAMRLCLLEGSTLASSSLAGATSTPI